MTEAHSYYGSLDETEKPVQSLSEYIVKDHEMNIFGVLREMEDRLKRHVTECKREIIREFLGINGKMELLKKGNLHGEPTETPDRNT